jgi:hypothetical protein
LKILSRRYLTAALLSVAAAAGVVTASAQPAAASFSDCPAGTGCVWTGQNGTGGRLVFSYSGSGGLNNCQDLLGLQIGSVYATYGNPVGAIEVFHAQGCDPAKGVIIPVGQRVNFATPFGMGSYILLRK